MKERQKEVDGETGQGKTQGGLKRGKKMFESESK